MDYQSATLNLAQRKARYDALVDAKTANDQGGAAIGALQTQAASDLAEAQSLMGTAVIGVYSSVDQLLRAERFAGKSASIDYIKAHPTGTESEAEDAWTTEALAVTGLPALVVPVASYAALYRANLMAAGLTTEATWEAQRDWIIATPKDIIMGA